jgi:aryl-alcohol dehydrogenase-like predicted oxidoreductase
MEYRRLGRTDLNVSAICLGTMTWGEQNTEVEAFAQMDLALAQGVNFWDTAELYPVPPRAETAGRTEEIIGNWLTSRGQRDKVILATKVKGRSAALAHQAGQARDLSRAQVLRAIEGSLKRLQTDYIDLYQLHWPDRPTNCFGQLGYVHQADAHSVPLRETLSALAEAVRAGKIRHVGLSNETPWGVLECLRLAEQEGLPRVVSIQNPYSLLNRSFEVGLAEMAIREEVGLLAYSPLAFGVLSGKYRGGTKPAGARLTLFKQFTRYLNPRAVAATEAYLAIAERHNLNPAQMALAFVTQQPFVTSNIIGATTLAQLEENIASSAVRLSADVLREIEAVQADNPNPAP